MPWIKLHKSLLDDRKFMCLPDDSKWLAIQLWLLASEGDEKGQIDCDMEDLAFRTRKNLRSLEGQLNLLIEKGFIENASTMLADCKQEASLDKIREDNNISANAVASASASDGFVDFWEKYPRKKDKKAAQRAWSKLSKKSRELALSDILTRFDGKDVNYLPYPATYLNGARWEDEPDGSVSEFQDMLRGGI
jgi:hypothetical protein